MIAFNLCGDNAVTTFLYMRKHIEAWRRLYTSENLVIISLGTCSVACSPDYYHQYDLFTIV